jgi:5-methylcytosine-specific restriction endonuclease McrA
MAKRAPPSGAFEHWPEWSNSKFWAFIRSGLRAKWSRYPVKYAVLDKAKMKAKNNPRAKWEYACAVCKKHFIQKDIEVDHLIPCGSLRGIEDLGGFVERLFCGEQHLQIVCKPCHKLITAEERKRNKENAE